MRYIERDTKDHIPVTVTNKVTGVSIITGVEFAVAPAGTIPTVWTAAVVSPDDANVIGFTLDGSVTALTPGEWTVRVRVTSGAYKPIERVPSGFVVT
jgi:hypothetical protein